MTWEFLLEKMGASRRLAEGTLLAYGQAVRQFSRQFPHLGPVEVQEKHLAAFLVGQRSRVSESTARHRARGVLSLLAWAHRRGLLLVNPGECLSLPKAPRLLPSILSPEQVQALLAAPLSCRRICIRYRDRALLELFYANGLRASEVSGLDLEDLELADFLVRVRDSKGNPRCAPLNEPSVEALRAYLEEARPALAGPGQRAVFLTLTGKRLKTKDMNFQLKHYGKMLGIPGLTTHALRHALATHLLENGANIVEIKKLLGHVDISSTQYYAQVRPVEMLREHRRYHPRSRRQRGSRREDS